MDHSYVIERNVALGITNYFSLQDDLLNNSGSFIIIQRRGRRRLQAPPPVRRRPQDVDRLPPPDLHTLGINAR